MSLSDSEKTSITSLWKIIHPVRKECGAEAFSKLFEKDPATEAFFPKFDLIPASDDLLNHGEKFINAIEEASKNPDNLTQSMAALREQHLKLKVGRAQVMMLCGCLLEVLHYIFPNEFTDSVQAAWKKLFNLVADALTSPSS